MYHNLILKYAVQIFLFAAYVEHYKVSMMGRFLVTNSLVTNILVTNNLITSQFGNKQFGD